VSAFEHTINITYRIVLYKSNVNYTLNLHFAKFVWYPFKLGDNNKIEKTQKGLLNAQLH